MMLSLKVFPRSRGMGSRRWFQWLKIPHISVSCQCLSHPLQHRLTGRQTQRFNKVLYTKAHGKTVKQANKAANVQIVSFSTPTIGLDFSRSELEGNECLLANGALKSYIYISKYRKSHPVLHWMGSILYKTAHSSLPYFAPSVICFGLLVVGDLFRFIQTLIFDSQEDSLPCRRDL